MNDWNAIWTDLAPLLVLCAMIVLMVTTIPLITWPIRFVKWWQITFSVVGFLVTGAANFWVATGLNFPEKQIHFGFVFACAVFILLTLGTAKKRFEWELENLFIAM